MHPQSLHSLPHSTLPTRLNKISSTLSILHPTTQTLTSRDQHLSTRHSHRKYKLSHSQIDKIERIEMGGTMRWSKRFEGKKQEYNHMTEDDEEKRQENEEHLSHSRKNQGIQHTSNYQVTRETLLQLQNDTSLHLQLIDFSIPSTSPNHPPVPISLISFQIHIPLTNTHFRSEFTYRTIPPEFRLIFDDLEEVFNYASAKQTNKNVRFCMEEFVLQMRVDFKRVTQLKTKVLKLPMLPFAVLEIVAHHQDSLQQQEAKRNLEDLNKDLEVQTNLVNALREQNDKLKSKLGNKEKEIDSLKMDNKLLQQSCQNMRKENQTNKQYFFQFIPDPRSKTLSHFYFKHNLLTKQKNDLKWDQLCSQSPFPHSHRHYFTIVPQSPNPDIMLGIITLKGKDIPNGFLSQQVICLYISKRNVFVYERGRHYKVSRVVEKGDTVEVFVDTERGVVGWLKKRGMKNDDSGQMDMGSEKHEERKQRIKENKVNQQQTCFLDSINQQQLQFIHSVKIPQQMLTHQLYAYLQVYNINEPLKLNQKI